MGSKMLLVMLFVFPSLLWASDAGTPSLDFLEFLAEGAVVDGKWTDPVEVREMSVSQTENSGDEVKSHE